MQPGSSFETCLFQMFLTLHNMYYRIDVILITEIHVFKHINTCVLKHINTYIKKFVSPSFTEITLCSNKLASIFLETCYLQGFVTLHYMHYRINITFIWEENFLIKKYLISKTLITLVLTYTQNL